MKIPAPPDLCLYHWSPIDRRPQIQRLGLVPGSRSIDRAWCPPFVCFSDDPAMAWQLSGKNHTDDKQWDLWMVYACDTNGYEMITDTFRDTGRTYVKEYRVYERIYKRDLTWIARRP